MHFTAQTKTIPDRISQNTFVYQKLPLFVVIELGVTDLATVTEEFAQFEKAKLKPQTFKKWLQALYAKYQLPSLVAVYVIDEVLTAVVLGGGSVYIARGKEATPILTQVGSLSGPVKADDRVLLLSTQRAQKIPLEKVTAALGKENVEQYEHILFPDKQTTGAGLAIAFTQLPQAANLATDAPTITSIDNRMRATLLSRRFLQAFLSRITRVKPLGWVIMLIGLALIISVVFGVLTQMRNRQEVKANDILTQVSHKLDEGMALIDLNPVRSREILEEAKLLLASASAKPGSETEKQLEMYQQKIDAGLAAAERKFTVTLEPFFKLELIKPDAVGNHLSLYQDALITLDTVHGTLYRLSINNKSSRLLLQQDLLKTAQSVVVYGEEILVLLDGVHRVQIATNSLEQIIAPDSEWGRITDAGVFDGNVYLLDPGKSWIWKYYQTDGSYGSRQDYLLFDTLVNISSAQEMAIDGYVWVADQERILRFSQGGEDVWRITGLEMPLGKDLDIYSDEYTAHLYILDRTNKRVIVLDKDGTYLAQYHWEAPDEITDFVVSEVINKILLLSRGTIYGIDLR
ncbi:hypothetical protein C4579_01525 [Candidatus Microgenomates bacterium]|nr:MAG: hypothetical protein C4579_01525 [Candidatus Microgenomates bacterium]